MAARYAVTTGNWTAAIWAATSGGAAGSAAVPTNADDATINKNVTVTIDATTCVALTLTLSNGTTGADTGGAIVFSTAANSKLTLERAITTTGVSTSAYMTTFTMDVSANYTYVAELVINNARSTTLANYQCLIRGNYKLKGFHKKRHTTITAAIAANATTCNVADATGWQVADRLVFATTLARSNTIGNGTDVVTIATITAVGGGAYSGTGAATLTWTDGLGAGGGVVNAHADTCPVGNFTSNCRVLGNTIGDNGVMDFNGDINQLNADSEVTNVEFYGLKGNSSTATGGLSVSFRSDKHKNYSHNAFYQYANLAFYLNYHHVQSTRQFNVFYSTDSQSRIMLSSNLGQSHACGEDTDYVSFASNFGIIVQYQDQNQRRHKISGCVNSGAGTTVPCLSAWGVPINVVECDFWNNYNPPSVFSSTVKFSDCRFDSKVFTGTSSFNGVIGTFAGAEVTAVDCEFPVGTLTIQGPTTLQSSSLQILNRDSDAAIQEFYQYQSATVPAIQRTTTASEYEHATSGMEFTFNSSVAQSYEVSILAKSGAALKLLLYVKKDATYNNAAFTLPSATLSGLGITPITASGTDVDATWELLTLDLAAINAPSSDGALTLTLSAQSATAGAQCWFSGIPISPFITRCRHYLYVFDETNPARVSNSTIDSGVSEATAAAYTGISISWNTGTTPSTTTLTLDQTFKDTYHYVQAQGCQNVGSNMPITGSGSFSSPVLFAAGNFTINTTKKLSGPGSLTMGSYTLTSDSPWAFTYTGGTFSRATTTSTVTFSGGTLNIGAAGTYTFTQAASMTVSATPTSASNYVLSSGTFTGTLTFWNTTAYNITVEVPAGTTTSSAGSPGAGTVTFVSPQVYQSVVITGFTAGSRIYIYDTEGAGELLFNGTTSSGETVISGSTCTWTDSTAAAANRVIFLRVAYVNGATAKEFIEVTTIGTCGTTDGTKTVSYIVAQTADTVYDTNGVSMDGTIFAACGITFTDAATDLVNINIAADTVALKTIYAAFAWWIFTALGIDDDVAYIRAIDPANYELTSMKFRNTATDPLKITGGYFYDSTGSVENCVDITSPGNIYPMPEHVVPYQTTGTYAITGDISTVLAAIPSDTDNATAVLAAAAATPIASNIKKVNDITVDGNGQDATPWGPA